MEKRLINGMRTNLTITRLKWLLPLVMCFLISCRKTRTPEGILTKPEMVKALMDIYMDEEKTSRLGLVKDSSEKVFEALKIRSFEKLNLTDTAFRRSIVYYSDRPKELEMIYSALVDSLQLREQRIPAMENPK
jgi:hypothetical protein